MVGSSQPPHLPPAHNLQLETLSPVKQEYIDGRVFAMVGACDAHVTLAGNLTSPEDEILTGPGNCARNALALYPVVFKPQSACRQLCARKIK